MDTVRFYDSKYEGVAAELFDGPVATPGNRISFRWPYAVDTGKMAPIAKETTPAVYIEGDAYMDSFFTKMAKIGWKMEPTMWDDEIAHGKMTMGLDFKIQQASQAIMRRKDFEGLRYAMGDSTTVARYSTQSLDRRKKWDIAADTALTGVSWSTTASADILFDLDTILYNSKLIGDEVMKKLIVGPLTYFSMSQNKDLQDQLVYTHDPRENIIGGELRGLSIKEIVYARYKDNSGYGTVVGGPGLGSTVYDTWTTMKSVSMMNETISGSVYEMGFIAADKIGTMFKAPVYTSPGYPTGDDVTNSWEDPESLVKKAWRAVRFGFAIGSWTSVHKLEKIAFVS
jgi:hypothetical protein